MNTKGEGGEIEIHCSFDEIRDVVAMVPHPRNPNQHPEAQVDLLARVIRHQGWRNPIVVSKRSGFIVAGHGRLAAAEKIGAQMVPVDLQDFATEADELAHLAADNRIAELAEMDQDQLGELLTELEGMEDFDFELSGFERASLDDLLGDTEDEPRGPGLVAEFGAAPFTVLDARTGPWQERKRAWLERGIASEDGRNENLAFAISSQPEEVYARKNKEEKKAGGKMTWEEFATKFPDAIVQKGTSIFDPVLTELIDRWWCPEGGKILDPFAGGSVRGLVAAYLGMDYTGIDLREEQVKANETQAEAFGELEGAARWITGDSRKVGELVEGAFDFLMSCPPYADLEVYSDDPQDLSNAGSYEDFLEAYREIIAASVSRLAENAFAVWVVGEIRDKAGSYRGFVPDTIRAFEDAGMSFYNEAILITPAGSLPMRVRKQFEGSRKLGKSHQNVLVFCKGDPREVAGRCTMSSIIEDEQGE